MGRNFSIKYVSILIIGLFCAIAMFSVGIFALKKLNLNMQMPASPDIFCKIEVAKISHSQTFVEGSATWKIIFDNHPGASTQVSEGITREWVNGAMKLSGGIFENITGSDTMYYRITNYTNLPTDLNDNPPALNVSLSNTEEYITSNPSYGVQNIVNGTSKYFSTNTNVLFKHDNQDFSFYLYLSTSATEFTINNSFTNIANVCNIVNKNIQTKAIAGKDYIAVIETTDDDYAVQITGVNRSGTPLVVNTNYYYDYSNHTLIVYGTALTTGSALEIIAQTKPKYVEVEIDYAQGVSIGYNGTTHVNNVADETLFLGIVDTESGIALLATPSDNYQIDYSVNVLNNDNTNGSSIFDDYIPNGSDDAVNIFVSPNLITTNLRITITQAQIA